MNWISSCVFRNAIIIVCALLFFVTSSFSQGAQPIILWASQAVHYNAPVKGLIFIQAAAFTTKKNALIYKNQLHALLKKPISIRSQHNRHLVLVGPLRTASQVRQVGLALRKPMPAVRKKQSVAPKTRVKSVKPQKIVHYQKPVRPKRHVSNQAPGLFLPFDWDSEPKDSRTVQAYFNTQESARKPQVYHRAVVQVVPKNGWYAGIDLGLLSVQSGSAMRVNNGSGFPSPYDTDSYTASDSSNEIALGVSAGFRWQNQRLWLPQYMLGFRYKYLFPEDRSGQIIQYSLPQFTNYNYTLNTSSNVFLVGGKADLYQYKRVLPYLSLGIGLALNDLSYSEKALPGVTPRSSPAFASQTSSHFAYTLGAGFDLKFTEQILFSIGYEFQELGALETGPGSAGGCLNWSNQTLSQSNYKANALTLSMTSFFN